MTSTQCMAGRALLQLAHRANVGLSTVVDFERQRRLVAPASIRKMQAAMEAAGVEFTNGKRPGVWLW
jgi:hypothetical protein